jgi:hypothetical protein
VSFARKAAVLTFFAVLYASVSVWSYRQKSATWDEPQNIATGVAMLRLGDYRMDAEHPPLMRKWAALPLFRDQDLRIETSSKDWQEGATWRWTQRFMYELNDADALLYRSRFMIVLLGLLLGGLLFAWADDLFGFVPAVAVLALYAFEPNMVAHASLVTTDFGVTCFMLATLYGLWRATRKLTFANGLAVAAGFTLAVTSKFSALLLLPMMALLLTVRAFGRDGWEFQLVRVGEWSRRRTRVLAAAGLLTATLLIGYAGMWAAYGFRYLPSPPDAPQIRFDTNPEIARHVPLLNKIGVWIDDHHLLPNACVHGFLRGQSKAQSRSAYLAGEQSSTGWWYFFPVAILIKTPLALLAVALAGLGLALRGAWRERWPLFVLVPIIVYLGAAMEGRLNIGLRHVLPLYPFMLIAAGAAIAWIVRRSQARWLWLAVPALALAEVAPVAPDWLAFFNVLVGGPAHGDQYLVDSNLDWGQELKNLKRWTDDHGIEQIYLAYFGSALPAYYGLKSTPLPGTGPNAELPKLPGWVAVSATTLHGVYLKPRFKEFYAPLLALTPDAIIGHSIFVYHVEKPWWTADPREPPLPPAPPR